MAYPARVLIDSGSSGNFISADFVARHRLNTVATADQHVVTLADGTEQRTAAMVKQADLSVAHYKGHEDLIVLPLQQYDCILGMPWLAKENPSIDWQKRTLTVTNAEGKCLTTTNELQHTKQPRNRNKEADPGTKNQKTLKSSRDDSAPPSSVEVKNDSSRLAALKNIFGLRTSIQEGNAQAKETYRALPVRSAW